MKPRQREAGDGVTPKVGVEMEGTGRKILVESAMETNSAADASQEGSAGRR